jgi:regulator of cell morphogenesis and NO signaling
MMNQQTVGQIAVQAPGAASVFEKYRIDYCCGGKRPLDEVCRERGISSEAVLAEVEQASAHAATDRDWTQASLSELIGHIVSTHHQYVKTELPLLDARLARVIQAHGARHGEMLKSLQSVFWGLRDELLAHLRKEEAILFPAIEELERARNEGRRPAPTPFGSVENPIRMMMFEHDSAGEALSRMHAITGDYALPPDACTTFKALYTGLQEFETDLHQHIHLENNILFPRAL